MATLEISTLHAPPTADEAVGSFVDAWAFMTSRFPGHRIVAESGVATTFANVPLPFLNIATVDRSLLEPTAFRRALCEARARAEDCEHPSMLALSGDWAPRDWQDLAAESGWLQSMALTAMAADRLLPPRRSEVRAASRMRRRTL
jgi:hypothetical protein